MPVDFLTPDEQGAYGRFAAELSPEQLARHFHLDEADRALIFGRRGERARLGFALQLGTVRFLGTFLPNPTQVPCGVLEYTARQLGLAEPRSALVGYAEGQTHWAHVREICERYGYRDFHEQPEHLRFLRWLYTRAWVSAERPSVLLDLATAWLLEHKILLPRVTTLARAVARVRDRAASRLWRVLSQLPSTEQRARLEALLTVVKENTKAINTLQRGQVQLIHLLERLHKRISAKAA